MCEAALLCRLTCSRFVASSSTELVANHGRGVTAKYKFEKDKTVVVIQVAVKARVEHTHTHSIVNDKLMKDVSPKGEDGGSIFTAALARRVIELTSFATIHREIEPGVAPSLPRVVDARNLSAMVAAFTKLKLHSFSTQMKMALFSQCCALKFEEARVVIMVGPRTRQVNVAAGGKFVVGGNQIYTEAESSMFNADILVVDICHTFMAILR